MSAQSHEQHLDRSDIERSSYRRRWFEQVVMLPVAVGMLTAEAGFTVRDMFGQVFGINHSLLGYDAQPLVIASAALASGAFAIALIRWRRS